MEEIRIIKVDGDVVVKESLNDVKSYLNKVTLFRRLVDELRDDVINLLIGRFGRLEVEDVEEIYDDGCMVLWKKMKDGMLELKDDSVKSYLIKVCRNIGTHYLRGVRDDVYSLDGMMSERFSDVSEDIDGCGMSEVFDIMDEEYGGSIEDRYEKLDKVWERLSDIDKIILESYYWEDCKMEDIAKKIGYKSGDSVKSKKSRVLKKMIGMMDEDREGEASLPDLCSAA